MPENSRKNHNLLKDITILKEWLKTQHHLPSNIEDKVIMRFLHSSNNSLEKAKQLIDLCLTLRSQAPEIFSNRDPQSEQVQNIFKIIDFVPLPKTTTQKYKVLLYRLTDSDADKFNYVDSLKVFFMVSDIRMYLDDTEIEGEVPIMDMSKMTLRHLTRVALPVLKKYMVYTQEAHPVRLKQIHILNTSPFLDRCMTLVRPFLKGEVAKLLHFHQPNSTTLFDFIPRELLPLEYGGYLESLETIKKQWINNVMENKEYFLEESRWKVEESLRSGSKGNSINNTQVFGVQGTFKTLNID